MEVVESPTALLQNNMEELDKLLTSLESASMPSIPEIRKKVIDVVAEMNRNLAKIKSLDPKLKEGLKKEIKELKERADGLNERLVNAGFESIKEKGGQQKPKEAKTPPEKGGLLANVGDVEERQEQAQETKQALVVAHAEETIGRINLITQEYGVESKEYVEKYQREVVEPYKQSDVFRSKSDDFLRNFLIEIHALKGVDPYSELAMRNRENVREVMMRRKAAEIVLKDETLKDDVKRERIDEIYKAADIEALRGLMEGWGYKEQFEAALLDISSSLISDAALECLDAVAADIREQILDSFREMDEERIKKYIEDAEEETGKEASPEEKAKKAVEAIEKDQKTEFAEKERAGLEKIFAVALAEGKRCKLSAEDIAKAIKKALEEAGKKKEST